MRFFSLRWISFWDEPGTKFIDTLIFTLFLQFFLMVLDFPTLVLLCEHPFPELTLESAMGVLCSEVDELRCSRLQFRMSPLNLHHVSRYHCVPRRGEGGEKGEDKCGKKR